MSADFLQILLGKLTHTSILLLPCVTILCYGHPLVVYQKIIVLSWSPPPEELFLTCYSMLMFYLHVLLMTCPICRLCSTASYGAYPICKGCSMCSRDNGCVNCQPKLFLFLRRERMRQYGECLHDCPAGYYGMRSPELNMCSSKSWPLHHTPTPPSLSHRHGFCLHAHMFQRPSWFIINYPGETHIPPDLNGSSVRAGGWK